MKKTWVVILLAETILLIAAAVIGYGIYTGRFGDLFPGTDPDMEAAATPRPAPAAPSGGDATAVRPLVTASVSLDGGVVTVEQTLAYPEVSDTLRAYLFAVNYADVTILSVGSDSGILGHTRNGPNLEVNLSQPGASFHIKYRILLPYDDSIMAARNNLVLMNKIFCTPAYMVNGEPVEAFLHPQFGSPFVYPLTDYRVTVRAD